MLLKKIADDEVANKKIKEEQQKDEPEDERQDKGGPVHYLAKW